MTTLETAPADPLFCCFCGIEAGSYVVCEQCRIGLSPKHHPGKYDKAMKALHKAVVLRDGQKCVHCDYSPQDGWKSGELGAGHIKSQGHDPAERFNTANCESTCKRCNGAEADGKLNERTSTKLRREKITGKSSRSFKRKICKVSRCVVIAGPSGKCAFHEAGL